MKLKRLMALGMAAVMTMSLTACGGSGDTPSTNNTPADNNAASDNNAAADNNASDNNAADNAADDSAADDSAAASGLTYGSITLGEDYTDLTASIKFIHHKTDREQDGSMAKYIEAFNQDYPNISVETEGITDYAQTALLRLPTGEAWGDVMFIPSIDMVQLPDYFIPYGTVDEMSEYINFADQWKFEGNCYGVGYMGNAQGLL